MKPSLESEAFAPLKGRGEFERIHNGKYFIEWGYGADLSANTILALWEPVLEVNTQQDVQVDTRASRS
ncbi:hypothetical protein [Nitrosomonas sp.]|uniref:hypothetical protein n=1 Tax=Nitrosomonas sp. TaxID=42353 RepID=UPI0026172CF2|nr:hypothetical protein [Nitrosomonas sp.]MCW5602806.1 hypothetical protein [Nitrosomonas sp.]